MLPAPGRHSAPYGLSSASSAPLPVSGCHRIVPPCQPASSSVRSWRSVSQLVRLLLRLPVLPGTCRRTLMGTFVSNVRSSASLYRITLYITRGRLRERVDQWGSCMHAAASCPCGGGLPLATCGPTPSPLFHRAPSSENASRPGRRGCHWPASAQASGATATQPFPSLPPLARKQAQLSSQRAVAVAMRCSHHFPDTAFVHRTRAWLLSRRGEESRMKEHGGWGWWIGLSAGPLLADGTWHLGHRPGQRSSSIPFASLSSTG